MVDFFNKANPNPNPDPDRDLPSLRDGWARVPIPLFLWCCGWEPGGPASSPLAADHSRAVAGFKGVEGLQNPH